VQLDLQDLWIKNITISMGLVNTTTLAMLLRLVAQQKLPVDKFITHRFDLADMVNAYATFGDAARTHAVKLLITR
jgi:alcohol dehydrogenase